MAISNSKWKCVSACLGGILGVISVQWMTTKTRKKLKNRIQDAILAAPHYYRRIAYHAKKGGSEANALFKLHAKDWKHTTKKIVRQVSHEFKTWQHKTK